jgi:hypothetical protein
VWSCIQCRDGEMRVANVIRRIDGFNVGKN